MAGTTGNIGLDALAKEIAEVVWVHLQDKFVSRDAQLVSIPEAARKLGISRTKLRDMITSEEFPVKCIRRIGSRVMVVVSEMERWVASAR